MRRLVSGLLLLIYLGTTTGFSLHTHYCMGRLAGWSLGFELSDICGKCGMDKSEGKDKGCCRDERHVLKSSVDQKSQSASFSLNLPLNNPAIQAIIPDHLIFRLPDPLASDSKYTAPPPLHSIAVHLRNCVFRI